MTRMRARFDLASRGDEGVALLMVVMLIMIVGALSVLVLGVTVAQVRPTQFGTKTEQTVFAAEAGIDATLSQLRLNLAAPDLLTGKIYGDPHKLPCTVSGHVGGSSTDLEYVTTITYFDVDPTGKDATWRAANDLTCSTTAGVAIAPSFALISSQGKDKAVMGLSAAAGNRTIETVYTFQVSNNNIDGGTIYNFGDTYCLQADGQTVNSTVSYVAATGCRTDDPRRLWSWGKDYSIKLAITTLGPAASELCLTGRPASAGNTVNATLQYCNATRTDQMFSWEGGARWRGQNSTNTDYSSFCLGAHSATAVLATTKLQVGSCLGDNTSNGSFDPDPRVGAGAAGYNTIQVVNYLEFGRCMDVTNTDVNYAFMIVYPCKQDPSGGSKLAWNHKWYYTEPTGLSGSLASQQIKVINGSTYCLTTPSATADPANPVMRACSSTSADQKWTRNALKDTYAESWTFTDRYGRCISLGAKMTQTVSGVTTNTPWSSMTVAPCNGGPEQKWNAPAKGQAAKLDDFKEMKD
ncbi:hypothetical protein [Cellulomonas sp.]|uniref:hypothetical protein n=1 Tax=Cellulomonas sp. TaxID=40001 RepID=UPI003BA8BC67